MKISDFGLSRDVYEEDSYVKRSKVKRQKRRHFWVYLWQFLNKKEQNVSLCFTGPYTCEMDGDRVPIRSLLHHPK